MKAGQWTDEQIVSVLQEAAKGEKPIATLCREKSISEATFYAWRKKFGGVGCPLGGSRKCGVFGNWRKRTLARKSCWRKEAAGRS